jgi:hypothetical protein
MPVAARQFKFSGRIAPQDWRHQFTRATKIEGAPDEHEIAPTTITVNITNPPNYGPIGVPQYGSSVSGGSASGYNPAADCSGNFMSYKYQPNNNCYAYGCNITPNTFPQPGRASGSLIQNIDGPTIQSFALQDGLSYVGKAMADLRSFAQQRRAQATGRTNANGLGGHFVALMISPAGDQLWPGDYHWARCDNSDGPCDSWSQKDGSDQVTNFDFAGNLITDPSTANWTVNQGPIQPDKSQPNFNSNDLIVDYAFYCFMFVPDSGVNIL